MVRTLTKKISALVASHRILKLANLNHRKARNGWSGKSTSSGANPETRGECGNQERSEGGDDYGGIREFLVRALLTLTQWCSRCPPDRCGTLIFRFRMNPSLILPRKVHIDTPQEFSRGSFKTKVRYFSRSTSITATLMWQ
jgi:hypothetical protein